MPSPVFLNERGHFENSPLSNSPLKNFLDRDCFAIPLFKFFLFSFLIFMTHIPFTVVHTLILGSGAAGLAAAVRLRRAGVGDLLIVTEGLEMGTSINTGSDKQTYYKMSLCGDEADCPLAMARTYFDGGSMHGDLALVEASVSARAFLNLVDLGVPFPQDGFGQFVGYKTDHDPRRRATSIGPYTSREMCRALIGEVRSLEIPVRENRVAVELLTEAAEAADGAGEGERRVVGAVLIDSDGRFEIVAAENVVFATGGPGGLYQASVYPAVHTGGIGLALMAGASAQNLPESQFGLASTRFRWNVSGTYMQVVPRFVSTEADGQSDPREFLTEFFPTPGAMHSKVFLKGYQWPFDARKVVDGSSLVDLLVYRETVLEGRRVFLDFRTEPDCFSFDALSDEARTYLEKSDARLETPIARLAKMNPGAIGVYADHGIDLTAEPLEIAVCAQHNNGGLAGNRWWESVNLKHLFPIGEVNGSHGVSRPGGSALNAGQVGAIRAADFIAHRYAEKTVDSARVRELGAAVVERLEDWLTRGAGALESWAETRETFQRRMSRSGAQIRRVEELDEVVEQAWQAFESFEAAGSQCEKNADRIEALRNRYLCFAHAVYLEAIRDALGAGVGSRGSAIVLDRQGEPIHEKLDDAWRIVPEDLAFRQKVLETKVDGPRRVTNRWVPRREIPEEDLWFETAWQRFREGAIFE